VHWRADHADGRKSIWWAHPDGRLSKNGEISGKNRLYGLELIDKQRKGALVEGEKTADALRAVMPPDVLVVAVVTGAPTVPLPAVLEKLKAVPEWLVWADADKNGKGQQLMEGCAAYLRSACKVRRVVWPEAPDGGDAYDYLRSHTRDELFALLKASPEWFTESLVVEQGRKAGQIEGHGGDRKHRGPVVVKPATLEDLGVSQQRLSEAAANNGFKPSIQGLRLSDYTSTEVRWLWPGYLPRGRLTLLHGDPGIGKSWASLSLAVALSLGAPFPGEDPATRRQPGKTLLFAGEDDPSDTLLPRFEAMGGDPSQVTVVTGSRLAPDEETRFFHLERDLDALTNTLNAERYELLLYDPLSAYLGSKIDNYRDTHVRAQLEPFLQVIRSKDVALLATGHLTKSMRDRALYRGQGSIAYVALARVVLVAGREPDRPQRVGVVCVKNNLAPTPRSLAFEIQDGRLLWIPGGTESSAEDLVAPEPTREETQAMKECQEDIIEYLRNAGGPVTPNKVIERMKHNGHTDSRIQRARTRLAHNQLIVVEKTGFTGGWVWRLP
jgi:hypothetical protein